MQSRFFAALVSTAHGLRQAVQIVGRRYNENVYLEAAEALETRLGVLTPIDPR